MKFGIFTIVPWHEDFTPADALNQALEQVEFADKMGIDEVWLGEHRFSRHGLLSGIFSFLGAVAARTKRIRIGTAVVVLPLHNPILVAEETAMLDVISGGRFNFGIGAGYQRQEFDGIGVDINESRERFTEAVDVIIKAWTEERLTYHGKFTNVDDLLVLPKPLQKPYPPLFQAVSTSPASVEFALAAFGFPAGGPNPLSMMNHALRRPPGESIGFEHVVEVVGPRGRCSGQGLFDSTGNIQKPDASGHERFHRYLIGGIKDSRCRPTGLQGLASERKRRKPRHIGCFES